MGKSYQRAYPSSSQSFRRLGMLLKTSYWLETKNGVRLLLRGGGFQHRGLKPRGKASHLTNAAAPRSLRGRKQAWLQSYARGGRFLCQSVTCW